MTYERDLAEMLTESRVVSIQHLSTDETKAIQKILGDSSEFDMIMTFREVK